MYRVSRGGYTRNLFIVVAYRKALRMGNRKKEINSHYLLLKIILCTCACIYHLNKQAVK